jgi:hypothetical protein
VKIELQHRFQSTAHDLKGLLDGCHKLSTYITRLERQSTLFPDRYDPDSYKGDGFELFTEALIKLSPVDNRIGISDYQVVEDGDIGVDGHGDGFDGKPATVQVKFRSNNDQVLTANADHLSNFVQASLRSKKFGGFGVDPETETNMLIVTTAKDLHHFTDSEMFGKQVRCLGRESLRRMVDNNHAFWDAFRELMGV